MNTPVKSFTTSVLAVVAVLLAATVFLVLRFGEFPVGAGMDDAYYVELARSLAEGRGPVIHLNDVTPPVRPDIFPLGFPLLLSPLAFLAPGSLGILKAIPILSFLALAPLCLWLARSSGRGLGVVLIALVCLNPWMIAFALRVFSDLPFTAVSLAAILLFMDQVRRPRPSTPGAVGVVLLTAAAIMIRTIGLALPLAMVGTLLTQRRPRTALGLVLAVGAALIPHAALTGRSGAGLITGAYLDQVFHGGEARIPRVTLVVTNFSGYLKELPVVMMPIFGNPLEHLFARAHLAWLYGPVQLFIGISLLSASLGGWLGTWQGGQAGWNGQAGVKVNPAAGFVMLYLGIYGGALLNFSGYPSGVQARLLLPVLPLLYLGLLLGARGYGPRMVRPIIMVILAAAFIHNGFRVARPLTEGPAEGEQVFIDPRPGSEWIQANTDPDALIMTRWPLRQHIHFRRPVIGYGTPEAGDFEERLEKFKVDYIWVAPPGPHAEGEVRSLLAANPRRYLQVQEGDESPDEGPETDWVLFKVRKEP